MTDRHLKKAFTVLWDYIKIGKRRLMSQKGSSLINIFGLSVGIAASAAIFSYVSFELTFDDFHSNKEFIYRVHLEGGDEQKTFPGLGPATEKYFANVIASVRLKEASLAFSANESKFIEDKIFFVDSGFFEVFDYDLISGDASKVLDAPNSIVISETAALKYFGELNVTGRVIYNMSNQPAHTAYKVTGVFKNVPDYSHLKFDFLISYNSLPESEESYPYRWSWRGLYTYVLLARGTDVAAIEQDFNMFLQTFKAVKYNSIPEKVAMTLVRIDKVHSWEGIHSFTETYVNINILKFLIALGTIIMVVSMVNYVNLATVRASDRAKEIGLRKVVGAVRSQIVSQYFVESALLIFISSIISIAIYIPFIHYLDSILGTRLFQIDFSRDPVIALVAFAVYLLLIVASVLYPALILSSHAPAKNLVRKVEWRSQGLNLGVRQVLVVFQFSSTIALLAITLAIYSQINHMKSQRLGIAIDQTLVIKPARLSDNRRHTTPNDILETINRVKSLAVVESITASDVIPGHQFSTYWYNMESEKAGATRVIENIEFAISNVSENFFDSYEIPVVAGRTFSPSDRTGRRIAIINEFSSRALGYGDPTEAIGTRLKLEHEYEIIGVVADYHHFSLKNAIVPTVFLNQHIGQPYYSVKLSSVGVDPQRIVANVEQLWTEVYPTDIFEYYFLDEEYNDQYKNEIQLSRIVIGVTAITVVICCLGLFSLMSYILKKRLREFGIRKILGGSPIDLLRIILRNQVFIILLSASIGLPIALLFVSNWINNFAYKYSIGVEFFALPVLGAVMVLIIAIAHQAINSINAKITEVIKEV